jgi:AbrB family looped-hinge helix DNA binding protein
VIGQALGTDFRVQVLTLASWRDCELLSDITKRGVWLKKYPKIVQCDSRGQIVIPKDIRDELKIDAGTGFWMFSVGEEGILLKKIPLEELSEHSIIVSEVKENASKVGISPKAVDKAVSQHKKKRSSKLEEL